MEFSATTAVRVNGDGPEDVLVDDAGRIYTGLDDGRVVRISADRRVIETIAQCPGRPLGIEFDSAGDLVVCASDAGLLSVDVARATVRTLADRAFDAPLIACNNAAVSRDGTVYFSESSRRFTIPRWRHDLVEHTRTGRLLRRNTDGTVDELLAGLDFANGVALTGDESAVIVAETGACRLVRVWCRGELAGKSEVFAELPGHPDNIATGSDGRIWVAIVSAVNPMLAPLRRTPHPVRQALLSLPEQLQPQMSPAVAALAYDADGSQVAHYAGRIDGFANLTGIRERDGMLYFGSLTGSTVVVMPAR